MQTVNIHDAKTHLSRLLAQVEQGESVIIARAGKPLAKLTPIDAASPRPARRLGFLSGQIEAPDDFDRMGSQEIGELFGGEVEQA